MALQGKNLFLDHLSHCSKPNQTVTKLKKCSEGLVTCDRTLGRCSTVLRLAVDTANIQHSYARTHTYARKGDTRSVR